MSVTRRTGAVSITALVGLALTIVMAHAVAPAWARQMGFDVWNLGSVREDAHLARARTDELCLKHDRMRHEIEASGYVVGRLTDGSLTLAEATDRLEPILAEREGFDLVWRLHYRTPTFRHGVAQYAIQRLRASIQDPGQRAKVSARLEAEYAAMK